MMDIERNDDERRTEWWQTSDATTTKWNGFSNETEENDDYTNDATKQSVSASSAMMTCKSPQALQRWCVKE
jgi:hypothetical protein